MRLLLLLDALDARGGALACWLDLLGALAGRHEIRVAAGRGGPERHGEAWPEGVGALRVRALAEAEEAEGDLAGLAPLLAWADVVHVQNVMNPRAIALAVDTGKAVVTIQDHRLFCPGPGRTLPDGARCATPFERADCAACLPDPDYHARLRALTAARRDATRGARITALSRYMADELAAAGLRGARVLPPWVREEEPRSQPGFGFLLGGRLVAHKGPELAHAAWRRSGAEAPLRVAGAGRLAEALEGATLLGWLDRGRWREELRTARALLFPARWQEPFGIAGLEALAVGTPVIAMDTGGVREWAEAGAILVPPGDVDAMAAGIAALQHDPDRARALGEAGRQDVTARFAREAVLARWEALLEEAAGR